ncbi:MAG: sirohydrochlorin chelatase, partial [Streptosporangiaceae bacterium]
DGAPLPRREAAGLGLPRRETPGLPRREAPDLPRRGGADVPGRGGADVPGQPVPGQPGLSLPRRTAAVRRRGRHRSAHRISVSSDAPALILAAPATSAADDRALAERIALAAADSCPGAAIMIGYLDDGPAGLAALLASAPDRDDEDPLPDAVVVPLLAGPHPVLDGQIEAVLGRSAAQVLLASHLGPHPLLAEALHDRLAEAGLARAGRARGINIAAGADGVLTVADRGPQAVSDAGVTALLLAARLAVPAAPAAIDDPAGVDSALAMLRDAGSRHPAIAPCVIGPESDLGEFDRLSAAVGAPRSGPLGDHAAVAQLVAVRYGEALARISLPSH